MGNRTTQCPHCGYVVRWDPETRKGPTVFYREGCCPSCDRSLGEEAPVSARRGSKRR